MFPRSLRRDTQILSAHDAAFASYGRVVDAPERRRPAYPRRVRRHGRRDGGRYYKDLLPRMAQFELALLDWAEEHKGARDDVAFADKCWPAFSSQSGFEPCYVNSRLVTRSIPVACEVDVYGALSEYLGMCASANMVTLLDINNSAPRRCGRSPSPSTACSATAGGRLRSHIAEGEILPVHTGPLGGISVFGIPEMDRFYRHVLIQKHFSHHGAVAFKHCGKVLFDVFRYLGVGDVSYNRPASLPYPTENPLA